MQFEIIAIIFAALAVTSGYIYYLYCTANFRRKAKLIDRIPGPKKYPLIGNVLDLVGVAYTDLPKYYEEKRKVHGPLFRIWLTFIPMVYVSDLTDIQVVLTSRAALNKSWLYKFLKCWGGNGLLLSEGALWQERRKLLDGTFHQSILEQFIPTMCEHCESFVEDLSAMLNEHSFDIYPGVMQLALRIVCETVMGTKFKPEDQEALEYMHAVREILSLIAERAFKVHLWNDFIYSFTSNYRRQEETLKILHGMSAKVIKEKQQERSTNSACSFAPEEIDEGKTTKKRAALLDCLLGSLESSEVKMSDEDIRNEVDNFILAGSETSSLAMTLAVHFLGSNPTVQDKAVEEIRSIYGESDRSPSLSDLSRLKYLECVIKETLRLGTPVPTISRYLTDDIELGKYVVPAGTEVMVDLDRVHRNEKYFTNPENFDPDRFRTKLTSKHNVLPFLAFSSSYRNCIGQKFAVMELKIFLSSLLRRYRVESRQTFEEIQPIANGTLQLPNGVHISITPRE